MFLLSPQYQRLVASLGDAPPQGIPLRQIVDALGEAAAAVLRPLLRRAGPLRAARGFGEEDPHGRNAAHYMAAAGAPAVVEAAAAFVRRATARLQQKDQKRGDGENGDDDDDDAAAAAAAEDGKATRRRRRSSSSSASSAGAVRHLGAAIGAALAARDSRGLRPLDVAVARWGYGDLTESLNALAEAARQAAAPATAAAGGAADEAQPSDSAEVAAAEEALWEGLSGGVAHVAAPARRVPSVDEDDAAAERRRAYYDDSSGSSSDNDNADANDDGGWDATTWNPAVAAVAAVAADAGVERALEDAPSPDPRCDILEVFPPSTDNNGTSAPSLREFLDEFVARGRPAVFRGAGRGLPIRSSFRKSAFVEQYGRHRVPVSTIPYAGSFGMRAAVTTMAELANATTDGGAAAAAAGQSYAFSTPMQDYIAEMQRDAPPPPFLAELLSGPEASAELQFFLGPAGSGAPVHFHGHAVNVLAYGAKRWFLYPPAAARYSKRAAQPFARDLHAAAAAAASEEAAAKKEREDDGASAWEPLECVQEAGDLMFVPTLWAHGTLNLKQSIGVAYELSVESFCME